MVILSTWNNGRNIPRLMLKFLQLFNVLFSICFISNKNFVENRLEFYIFRIINPQYFTVGANAKNKIEPLKCFKLALHFSDIFFIKILDFSFFLHQIYKFLMLKSV
jgi:hypothetical protein